MARKPAENSETVKFPASAFSKEQILKSVRYSDKRDLLFALLGDGVQYSHDDVQNLIKDFLKKEVG